MDEQPLDRKSIALSGFDLVKAEAQELLLSGPQDSYVYQVYAGPHEVVVHVGDSVWWLGVSPDQPGRSVSAHMLGYGEGWAHVRSGPTRIHSGTLAVVLRGYTPTDQSVRVGQRGPVLPYVNGCSTRQVIAPARLGDPSWQYLYMPPYSKEQAHHIHSTARVVYVLRGSGVAVVGMGQGVRVPLSRGQVVRLAPMCPHHFETAGEALEVLPLHIWSSVPGEQAHTMRLGTFLTEEER